MTRPLTLAELIVSCAAARAGATTACNTMHVATTTDDILTGFLP
jgi:hypothetical protein